MQKIYLLANCNLIARWSFLMNKLYENRSSFGMYIYMYIYNNVIEALMNLFSQNQVRAPKSSNFKKSLTVRKNTRHLLKQSVHYGLEHQHQPSHIQFIKQILHWLRFKFNALKPCYIKFLEKLVENM